MNQSKRFFISIFAMFSLISTAPVLAGHGNPGHGVGHGIGHGATHGIGHGVSHGVGHAYGYTKQANKIASKSTIATPRFSDAERNSIKTFVTNNPHVVSPTTLPPGIAMNLARGKPLPPGIAKTYLPSGALSSLPNIPGYEYLVVGKDVVMVNQSNGIVSDIISNIIK